MMQRHSTAWHDALDAHVLGHRDLPFAWGSNDCCTFAADWVCIATGRDPMKGLRGLDSASSAARALDGAGGLRAAVSARLGEPVAGGMAQVGDVALVRHGENRLSIGVCVGAAIAAPGERELLTVPITQAEAAWRV